MVMMSALAIISFPLMRAGISTWLFPETHWVSGAGGKPLSNGGPPEARLGYLGARTLGWAVTPVGAKREGKRGTWRAEVGPMLPGDCARPVRFGGEFVLSLECLVFPEIGDRQPQGIRQNLGVWNLVPEREEKARGVERALRNRMV